MKQINKGTYFTKDGHKAVVAQIVPVGGEQWMARGAVEHDGVWYVQIWNQYGQHSHSELMNIGEKR